MLELTTLLCKVSWLRTL